MSRPPDSPASRYGDHAAAHRHRYRPRPRRPLAATPWADAFHACGEPLANLAHDGLLERGVREILACRAIFHWNRAGLQARQQSLLAHAARTAILGPTPRRKATSQPTSDFRPKPPSNTPDYRHGFPRYYTASRSCPART